MVARINTKGRSHIVRIPNVWLPALCRHVEKLVTTAGRRRDFRMPGFETDRHMSTLSADALDRLSSFFGLEYRNRILWVAEAVLGLALDLAETSVERYVMNRLHRPGDQHGGHLDDYPFAVTVLVGSSSNPDSSAWFRDEQGRVNRVPLVVGDAYLL